MSGPDLVLVGAPAAGKSTVGARVAQRAGVGFTDTDVLLSERLGLSLPEAWASLPPTAIAAAEAEVCLAALTAPGVVALGSGAVADPGIRVALAGRTVLWLEVSVAHASRRLGLVALGMDALLAMRSRLDSLLRERERWYEEVSTLRLDTDRLTVADAVEGVERLWAGG
ncbi:MAG: shikimate kinase [Propionicimonas sp.]|nr:shikimate kinase [Propionicimonas sp.]